VVSVNGVPASLAVNEFAMFVSGVRLVPAKTEFDLMGRGRSTPAQWVTPVHVNQRAGCVECAKAGLGDKTDLGRYHPVEPEAA
jgi:hypothetical protein